MTLATCTAVVKPAGFTSAVRQLWQDVWHSVLPSCFQFEHSSDVHSICQHSRRLAPRNGIDCAAVIFPRCENGHLSLAAQNPLASASKNASQSRITPRQATIPWMTLSNVCLDQNSPTNREKLSNKQLKVPGSSDKTAKKPSFAAVLSFEFRCCKSTTNLRSVWSGLLGKAAQR